MKQKIKPKSAPSSPIMDDVAMKAKHFSFPQTPQLRHHDKEIEDETMKNVPLSMEVETDLEESDHPMAPPLSQNEESDQPMAETESSSANDALNEAEVKETLEKLEKLEKISQSLSQIQQTLLEHAQQIPQQAARLAALLWKQRATRPLTKAAWEKLVLEQKIATRSIHYNVGLQGEAFMRAILELDGIIGGDEVRATRKWLVRFATCNLHAADALKKRARNLLNFIDKFEQVKLFREEPQPVPKQIPIKKQAPQPKPAPQRRRAPQSFWNHPPYDDYDYDYDPYGNPFAPFMSTPRRRPVRRVQPQPMFSDWPFFF